MEEQEIPIGTRVKTNHNVIDWVALGFEKYANKLGTVVENPLSEEMRVSDEYVILLDGKTTSLLFMRDEFDIVFESNESSESIDDDLANELEKDEFFAIEHESDEDLTPVESLNNDEKTLLMMSANVHHVFRLRGNEIPKEELVEILGEEFKITKTSVKFTYKSKGQTEIWFYHKIKAKD